MTVVNYRTALIVGAGSGLSASLARAFAKAGMKVALAARSTGKLQPLASEIGATALACDATKADDVAKLFRAVTEQIGEPEVVVYNASYRQRGPFVELDPAEVEKSLTVTAYGGFLVAQEAARRMLPRGRGALLFTGTCGAARVAVRRVGFPKPLKYLNFQ